jgi:hypothetical protein
VVISTSLITTFLNSFAQSEGETLVGGNIADKREKRIDVIETDKTMKSVLEDFSGDTDEDLAVLVQEYRATIADLTDEIEDKERRPTDLDEVMRDAIDTLKWERDGERERLEKIEAEQKRRTATSKGVSLEC